MAHTWTSSRLQRQAHLSGIARLAPLLTEANRESVLARASGMSKREIEELVAELSPREDVPATIRKLPDRREKTKPNASGLLVPERVEGSKSDSGKRPIDDVEKTPTPPAAVAARPAVVAPLSPSRYRIQFTASAELCDKLERLRALMRSSVPDGDLATILEVAVTEKLERLESKRFGKTKAPRKILEEAKTSASSRYIPAAVKRAVYTRDQGQCGYIDPMGRRCTETERLEFHHRRPFGRGGDHNVGNIQLACRAHNGYYAERDYGKEVMKRYRSNRRSGGRVSESAPVYAFSNRARDTRSRHVETAAALRPRNFLSFFLKIGCSSDGAQSTCAFRVPTKEHAEWHVRWRLWESYGTIEKRPMRAGR